MSEQFLSVDTANVGPGQALPMTKSQNAKQIHWFIVIPHGVTAGKVTIRCAHHEAYSGSWSLLDELDMATGGVANSVKHGTYPGPIPSIRGEVETQFTGGGAPGVKVIFVFFGDI